MERDFCDSCDTPVDAVVFIELPSKRELCYCGHHYDYKHKEPLAAIGAFILDTRE